MKILFVCAGNSVRSPIAEGLAREAFGPSVSVFSRGYLPSDSVDRFAVGLARREGADISGHKPQMATKEDLASADLVVDLSESRIFESAVEQARYVSLPVPDPSGVTGSIKEIGQAWLTAGKIIKDGIVELKKRVFPNG